jgi:hypothetical protein
MKEDIWYRLLTMYIPFVISYLIYKRVDRNYRFSKKITKMLTIKKEWKPFVVISSTFLIIIILGMIGIYVIVFSDTVYFILAGTIFGLGISISGNINKLSKDRNNENI